MMIIKLFYVGFTGLLLLAVPEQANAFLGPRAPPSGHFPRRIIAGVSVVDTPLVRASQQYARAHGDDFIYSHIMRSWLFGTLLLQHNKTLAATVDPEVHAVAAILHDLGLDRAPNSPIVSPDRRFDVDGAIAARDFIRAHRDGKRWEERRVQLVWDAIALHGDFRITLFKEPEVAAVGMGVRMDSSEPTNGVTQEEYDGVLAEFPQENFLDAIIETMHWLCATKPITTYENFMQGWGEVFVPGYTSVGNRTVDRVLNSTRSFNFH
jgi:hypothetical protein